jgi:hypothetical protein
MYVYTCIYINICIYIYIYVYIYIHIYICIHIYTYIYIYVYLHRYIYMYIHICTCVYMRIYVWMCIYMYTYIFEFICKYLYTCAYICMYEFIYEYMYLHRCLNVYLSLCVHDVYIYTCIFIPLSICLYIHVYIYIYIYICIYRYVYIYTDHKIFKEKEDEDGFWKYFLTNSYYFKILVVNVIILCGMLFILFDFELEKTEVQLRGGIQIIVADITLWLVLSIITISGLAIIRHYPGMLYTINKGERTYETWNKIGHFILLVRILVTLTRFKNLARSQGKCTSMHVYTFFYIVFLYMYLFMHILLI